MVMLPESDGDRSASSFPTPDNKAKFIPNAMRACYRSGFVLCFVLCACVCVCVKSCAGVHLPGHARAPWTAAKWMWRGRAGVSQIEGVLRQRFGNRGPRDRLFVSRSLSA